MALNNTKVILKETPVGMPTADQFEAVPADLPAIGEGEVLVKNLWLSLDPYMRSQISARHISGAVLPGDTMKGETIAEVVESNSADFKAGDKVRCFGGWQAYAALPAAALTKVPDNVEHSPYLLSILGMPGLTAYAGLIWQAQPKAGDTVVVAAATGAVGSMVVQLAKQHGCRVVAIAGGQHKCDFAVNELGADVCIDRHKEDLATALDTHCPDGINIYFDLIGGDILELCSQRLAVGARMILCGLAADYNRTTSTPPPGPSPVYIIKSRATVFGLVVYDFEPRRAEFIEACASLVGEGKIKIREQVVEGLANAGQGFVDLLSGDNFGKVLVKIA
ncbi:MDR family NADP-dependent oxidoreductase [Alteromonas lipolytica]|uniref:NADP-dependent oxidoreductase n=1 Tax=Alteromonas lipolytica TaxID=1856405 RepID=A0A1E8FBL6_9ALTE|nr:NADP-dependent oxidoreductase [Alteromonas lipolytica]OFI33300.1 NADP-dependent oxidoreductase [Alteromonas lipolytica]GGF60857.1 NADP-dependent oxidoreductase [Alteromonas lipolytica]